MKKLVALFICFSLVLVPCFAYADTASGSALTLDEQLWIMNEGGIKPIQVAASEASSIKAATADNTPVFINGYAMPSSMNFYYFGSGSQATSFTNAYSQLPHLFQAITYSIAYSTQNLNTKIQTALTTLNTAVSNIKTGVADINGYSGSISTDTSNIYTRLGTMNTSLNNLKTYTDGVETTLTNILTAIQNQSLTIPQSLLDDVDSLANNQTKPSDLSKWLTSGWGKFDQYYYSPSSFSETYRLWDITNSGSYFYNLLDAIVKNGNTNATALKVAMWRGNKSYLDDDLILQTGEWTNSYNNAFVFYFQQIQYDLKKLRFVLASDDEIAARQAAATNTAAAVSNVISSSGSGSAKPADISGVADLKSSTVDSISSGVSASTVFSQTGSGGHAWDWFTQDIADELSAPSSRSNVRSNSKSSGSDTPYLDAYYHDLEEAIGFKLPW